MGEAAFLSPGESSSVAIIGTRKFIVVYFCLIHFGCDDEFICNYFFKLSPPAQSVRLIGAEGAAAHINGIFEPTSPPELRHGHLTYRNRYQKDLWLEYYGAKKMWLVTSTKDKGSDKCFAWIGSELRVDLCLSGN
jgi:hypothetical protein